MLGSARPESASSLVLDLIENDPGQDPNRTRSRSVVAIKVLVSVFIVGTLISLVFASAYKNPSERINTELISSMPLISGSGSSPLFNSQLLEPGVTASKCVSLTYSGPSTGNALVYFGISNYSGSLLSYLNLEVDEGSGGNLGDCTGFTQVGPSIYNGTLSGAQYNSGTQTPPIATNWNTGTTSQSSYRIVISVQNNNAAMGLSGNAEIDWELTSTAATTTTAGSGGGGGGGITTTTQQSTTTTQATNTTTTTQPPTTTSTTSAGGTGGVIKDQPGGGTSGGGNWGPLPGGPGSGGSGSGSGGSGSGGPGSGGSGGSGSGSGSGTGGGSGTGTNGGQGGTGGFGAGSGNGAGGNGAGGFGSGGQGSSGVGTGGSGANGGSGSGTGAANGSNGSSSGAGSGSSSPGSGSANGNSGGSGGSSSVSNRPGSTGKAGGRPTRGKGRSGSSGSGSSVGRNGTTQEALGSLGASGNSAQAGANGGGSSANGADGPWGGIGSILTGSVDNPFSHLNLKKLSSLGKGIVNHAPFIILLVGGLILFLLGQDAIDRRDPKLMMANVSGDPSLEFLPPDDDDHEEEGGVV